MCGSIDHIASRYRKISIWIIAGLMLIVLFTAQVLSNKNPILDMVLMPLVVSVVFSLITSIVYGKTWCSVAKSSPSSLAKYYLVAPLLKMMAAALVVIITALVLRPDKNAILGFIAVFVTFYIILLIFDCVYFSRIEKKLK